jgi:predicted DNA-binding transcriptional regulator AlpA|tara:strand:+ start:761 stop:1018 length:258 start_codon:yes stop_codon:yes gene_type:complete
MIAWPLSLQAVSRLLGIDKTTIYNYIERGEVVPSYRMKGDRHYWRFRPADVTRVCDCYERTLSWQKANVPGMYNRRLEKYRRWEP